MTLFSLTDVRLERPAPGGGVQTVLNGTSIDFPATGITCLVGPSGSGKSSLLRLLNRLEEPTAGSIAFRGADLRTLDPLELRRRVGLVLQTPVMLPGTVRDNLAAGLLVRGQSLANPEFWLHRVRLAPALLERQAADLSGGEKQRVALARTLVTDPDVLLLDEVTASLDAEAAAAMEELILGLGLPAIWVSHDPAQVRRVANRVVRVEAGLLREEVLTA